MYFNKQKLMPSDFFLFIVFNRRSVPSYTSDFNFRQKEKKESERDERGDTLFFIFFLFFVLSIQDDPAIYT